MKAIKCPDCGASVSLRPYFEQLGAQGGKSRAARQTPEQRSATARAGARATNELLAKRRAAKKNQEDTRVDRERLFQRQDLPQPAPGDE